MESQKFEKKYLQCRLFIVSEGHGNCFQMSVIDQIIAAYKNHLCKLLIASEGHGDCFRFQLYCNLSSNNSSL